MGTGLNDGMLTEESKGIVPRAISEIFESLISKSSPSPSQQTDATRSGGNSQTGYEWNLYVSFLELYNEDLVDLLNPRPKSASSSSSAVSGGPTVREDSQGNIVWSGIREEEVKSPEELMR
jgi:hypothetical protein